MQRILDGYRSGVLIQGVAIRESDPPAPVTEAFRNVNAAQQRRESYMNDARGYAQRVLERARGAEYRATNFRSFDTICSATQDRQDAVEALLAALDRRGVGVDRIGVHFHDTYGQALANTLTALRAGVTVVDASTGGLGGCPYAKSATGNLATEDLVWMLDGAGVETGVDLDALVETSAWMAQQLGKASPSRVVKALSGG